MPDQRNTAQLLDDVDDVLSNWHGSVDSMQWRAPELPCSTPIITPPSGLRIWTDIEGLDGYAAQALAEWYARNALRLLSTQVNEAMRILAGQWQLMTEAFRQAAAALAPLAQAMQTFGVREVDVANDDPFLRLIEYKRRRSAPPGAFVPARSRRPRAER